MYDDHIKSRSVLDCSMIPHATSTSAVLVVDAIVVLIEAAGSMSECRK